MFNSNNLFRNYWFWANLWHWQLKSQSVSDEKLSPQWTQTCVEHANFSSSEHIQIWSDSHRIFFVHIANFLLYLNKILIMTEHHRERLKNDFFAANRQCRYLRHYHSNQPRAVLVSWKNLLFKDISWLIIRYYLTFWKLHVLFVCTNTVHAK